MHVSYWNKTLNFWRWKTFLSLIFKHLYFWKNYNAFTFYFIETVASMMTKNEGYQRKVQKFAASETMKCSETYIDIK